MNNGLNVAPSQSYHKASEDFKWTAFIVIYEAWQLLDPIHVLLNGKEQRQHSAKLIFLCSTKESKSERFEQYESD